MERKDNACILWSDTRKLAERRGMTMDTKCPIVEHCKGDCKLMTEDGEIYPRNDFMLKQLRLELKGMDSNE
jgi:hypothetical protein